MRQLGWGFLFFCLVVGMADAAPQTVESVPTAATIISRMAQARAENRNRFRPYIITRDYKLFGKDESKAKSEVIADVAFVPPDSKKYTIEQTNGSGLGQILVRRMLANESEVTKDYVATDISADNYDFHFIREVEAGGQHCYVMKLVPRRKDIHLLRGNIWVDADTFLLHRFEGEIAKTPSWWVRNVRVTFIYSGVSGMWLQTAMEAAADVRILGRTTMVSHDVKYKVTNIVATAPSVHTNVTDVIPESPFGFGAVAKQSK
jgi:hypothetical protein